MKSVPKPVARSPLAVFTEFLESEECFSFVDSAACQIEDAQDASLGLDWIKSMVRDYGANDNAIGDTLEGMQQTADLLEGAAMDLRQIIEAYHRFSGAIDDATKAIEAFGSSQTTENRNALLAKSEALDGHRIAMPERLRRQLRPHLPTRKLKSGIHFGALSYIAKNLFVTDAKDAA